MPSLLASIESTASGSAPTPSFGIVPGLTTGSIAFGGAAKRLIFLANVTLDPTGSGDECAEFQFAVDGVLEGPIVTANRDAIDLLTGLTGFIFARTGLVGSHTITLQWRQVQGVSQVDTARVRNLQVLEFDA